MPMTSGTKCFARIDYPIEGMKLNEQVYNDCVAYLREQAKARFFKAGVFTNANGALVLFHAKDMEAAHEITRNDPIIQGGFYRYELYHWELLIASVDAGQESENP